MARTNPRRRLTPTRIPRFLSASIALTALVALSLPAAAGAETISLTTSGGESVIRVSASGNEANHLSIWQQNGSIVIEESGSVSDFDLANTVKKIGCAKPPVPGNQITCPVDQVDSLEISTANLDDNVYLQGGFGVLQKDAIVTLGTGADQATGGNGDDRIDGEGDDDILNGWLGKDTVEGGSDQDRISDEGGADNDLSGGSGDDLVKGSASDDNLHGDSGNDLIYGAQGDDEIWGGSQNDCVAGGDGADALHGDEDEDWLYGEGVESSADPYPNPDCMGKDPDQPSSGAFQDDRLDGGRGADYMWGGPGDDTVDYSYMASGQQAGGVHVSIDPLDDGYRSPAPSDECTSPQQAGFLEPNGDLYACGDGSWSADVEPVVGRLDQVKSDVENVTGTSGRDSVKGNNADNVLKGMAGPDYLDGAGGNDIFLTPTLDGADELQGGDGRDTVDYSSRGQAVFVRPGNRAFDDGEPAEADKVEKTEIVEGGRGDDRLWADDDYTTTLHGNQGGDEINLTNSPGHEHSDVASCGAHPDRVIGTGIDTIEDPQACETVEGIAVPSGEGPGGGGPGEVSPVTTTKPIIVKPGISAVAGGTLASVRSSVVPVGRNGAALVSIRCPESDSNGCKGTITVVGGQGNSKLAGRRIALGFFDLNPGDDQVVRLDVPLRIRKVLLKAKRVKANVNVSVAIGGGEKKIKSKPVTLQAKKKSTKRSKSKRGKR